MTLQMRLYRQLEREEYALQADLFAQAGLERALIRLRAEPEYRQEEWKPSTGKATGSVKIAIVPSASVAQEFQIQIASRFPADSEDSPQSTREVTIQRSN